MCCELLCLKDQEGDEFGRAYLQDPRRLPHGKFQDYFQGHIKITIKKASKPNYNQSNALLLLSSSLEEPKDFNFSENVQHMTR